MNFAGGDAFLKNPAVRTKFLKVDFGEPGPIFENRAVCPKFRKLDFGDGDVVLRKRRNSILVAVLREKTAVWFCEKGENSILVTAIWFC